MIEAELEAERRFKESQAPQIHRYGETLKQGLWEDNAALEDDEESDHEEPPPTQAPLIGVDMKSPRSRKGSLGTAVPFSKRDPNANANANPLQPQSSDSTTLTLTLTPTP